MVLNFQPISKGPSRLLNLLFRTTVPRRPDLAEMVRAWSEILLVPSSQLASSGLTLWELAKPALGENQVSMMNQGVYGHPSVESGRLDGMETARSFSAMLNPATVHVSHDSMLAIFGKLKLPAPFTAFIMEITYPIIEALCLDQRRSGQGHLSCGSKPRSWETPAQRYHHRWETASLLESFLLRYR